MCFELARLDGSMNMFAPDEPAYIKRLQIELTSLILLLQPLAMDCEFAARQRLPMTIRAKWIWDRSRVNKLCVKARRVQGYLQSAMNMIAFRTSL